MGEKDITRHEHQVNRKTIMHVSTCFFLTYSWTFVNYWKRLSKISWFVGGEQINYLPMPRAVRQTIGSPKRRVECTKCFQMPIYIKLATFLCYLSRAASTQWKALFIYIEFYIYEQCFSLSACGARQITEEWGELNPMFTKIEDNVLAQSIICSWATFLTNAHAHYLHAVICR